jgi:hypothetical protein
MKRVMDDEEHPGDTVPPQQGEKGVARAAVPAYDQTLTSTLRVVPGVVHIDGIGPDLVLCRTQFSNEGALLVRHLSGALESWCGCGGRQSSVAACLDTLQVDVAAYQAFLQAVMNLHERLPEHNIVVGCCFCGGTRDAQP